MTTLIVATQFSELLLKVALQEKDRTFGDICFLSPDLETFRAIKPYGINPIFLSLDSGHLNWEIRDRHFREYAMPGEGLDFNLPDTVLPAWKVLGLDRLNLWYQDDINERLADLIFALKYEKLFVTVDLSSSLSWVLAKNDNAVGVMASPVKSREVLDYAKYFPFSSLLVESELDKSFLIGAGFPREIVVMETETIPLKKSSIIPEEKKSMRQGLGISNDQEVILVFFEVQTEWAFRRWLNHYLSSGQRKKIFIYPENPQAKKILFEICDIGLYSVNNFIVTDSMEVEIAADVFYCFRYREDIVRPRKIPVKIMDVADRFKSSKMESVVS